MSETSDKIKLDDRDLLIEGLAEHGKAKSEVIRKMTAALERDNHHEGDGELDRIVMEALKL